MPVPVVGVVPTRRKGSVLEVLREISNLILIQLTKQKYDSKGGFIQRFEQLGSTVPVEYSAHNGSFSGYWITIQADYIFGVATSVTWSAYACTTGHPISTYLRLRFASSSRKKEPDLSYR